MSTNNSTLKHITHYHNSESGTLHQNMFSKSHIVIYVIRNTVSEREKVRETVTMREKDSEKEYGERKRERERETETLLVREKLREKKRHS